MNAFWRTLITPLVRSNPLQRCIVRKSPHAAFCKVYSNITPALLKYKELPSNLAVYRYKSKKAQVDSDEEDDEVFDDDSSLSKDSRIVKFSTTSMRTDGILKSALGVARNKIETVFYESRIRVNGKKILKKSAPVRQGDEIDVIKSVSPKNPDHLYVSRVEVINVAPKEDSISVTARRFKTLLIENYEADPYKVSSSSDDN